MNTRRIVLITASLLIMVSLRAQNRLEISLEEAIRYAVDNNRQLKSASYAIQESRASHIATIAQGLPQAEASYDYQNFFNAEAQLGLMKFEFNPTSNLNFRANQLLFSGSYIVGLQMSKLYKEISEVNFQKTDADIRAQVINSYSLVLISQRSKEIIKQNVVNMEEVLSKTQALVTVGILDETDKDQISLQKAMLENAVRTAERQVEMAINLLRLQLNVPVTTEIILKDNLLNLMVSADVENTIQGIFDINRNFDYRLMELQTSMAAKQLNMERVKFLPTAAGFFNYIEKIKKPELDFQPKSVIGLNISIPLFSSGSRYFNQAKAQYHLRSVENQLSMVADQLHIQESQLRFNLKNAMEQYEVQKENIALAQRVYDNVLLKYQQGVASSLDVTTANSNILQAENSYTMAIMQVLEAKTAMDKLLNKLN
ncbi:MAG: TolC family protein [Bacteroidales bacterium]|nr:TolC family protein [Bacteroidales bacterium]